jgi:hypothetical protein
MDGWMDGENAVCIRSGISFNCLKKEFLAFVATGI